jgi:CPA1 family monovalent cation:H+ antiporter
METVTIALLLLLAVVGSNLLLRAVPVPLPLPIVQIGLGAVLARGTRHGIALQPDLFFLLFLPPLLFLDGWRIPKRGFFHDANTILALAIGLVVFTVLGMGPFIHWMIPSMPLAVAFALAAVLSPTDPIAVAAVASRVPIPKRLMHILEGEALLNDASGLVCLQFAITAALTGHFYLTQAFMTFLRLAVFGIVIGVAVTLAVGLLQDLLVKRFGEDPGNEILISLLIPFGAYIAAEHVQGSGILAAVAAGITMTYTEISGRRLAITRIRRAAVWDTVQVVANGTIFVLLGEQLPSIVSRVAAVVNGSNDSPAVLLPVYILAITAGLALLRFIWVWTSLKFVLLRTAHRGEARPYPGWRLVAATSLAGAKGAVTLAGIFTLPLALPDGTPFPDRQLAIFLAMGCILLSLVAASLGLPPLLRGLRLPPEPSHQAEEDAIRRDITAAAIRAIEQAQHNMAQGRSDADLRSGPHVMNSIACAASGILRMKPCSGSCARSTSTRRGTWNSRRSPSSGRDLNYAVQTRRTARPIEDCSTRETLKRPPITASLDNREGVASTGMVDTAQSRDAGRAGAADAASGAA